MYRAKAAGKARYELFEPAVNAEVMARLERENDLRGALDRDELLLHYQPVVTLATSKINQVEALLRWQHPSGDLIRPADFVPLADETGLILPIGSWVLATACHQARHWHDQAPDEPPVTMSVNVSIRQLQHPDFVAEVASVLQETGLPAAHLQLELTESVLVDHWEGTIATLHALHRLGVHLALDDFGTGYSSLSYLQRLPARVLKVDKMFVNDVATNRETQAILAAIVRLGHAMGMQVTAEGIETAAQLQCVRELGVDMVQSYHYGWPLPADAASRHIADYALTQG
jgi:EAL domain-containing protein (putative c-di-GMP-specific phosphodiesterase class I)